MLHIINRSRRFLESFPSHEASKVVAITEAKDLKVLIMDALVVNLQTYEVHRKQDFSKKDANKDKSLALRIS